MPDARQLARVLRVREVQHRLAQADEARARDKAQSEAQLADRIARLAAEPSPAAGSGTTLVAAAHYRQRLQQSAAAAETRRAAADAAAARAGDATQAARLDQTAAEKLLERARADAAAAALRAAFDLPGVPRPRDRHGPC